MTQPRPERAAESFFFPFRPGWPRAWAIGVPLALVCPIGIVPLLGYTVGATRALRADPAAGLPSWRLSGRLLADGALLLLLLALVTLPFAVALVFASEAVATVLPVSDAFLRHAYATLAAGGPLAFLWALAALLVVPASVSRYAAGGGARTLFDPAGAVALARRRFWDWNLAGVPIVTAWALAGLSVFLCGIGLAFGVFYALLVSAHASSTIAE